MSERKIQKIEVYYVFSYSMCKRFRSKLSKSVSDCDFLYDIILLEIKKL